ncbi:MAG: DEDD exonuclease domain-containing protein [Geodermatophilaceae bacterium]|nr:DEDD exonuclease domain-containing protein [Geodermatophilaceae bacterium]
MLRRDRLSSPSGSPAVATLRSPYVQVSIDELGTPLREVTFVVVDLETTGGSPEGCAITEIGAVRVRGGEILGEFQTLVDPGSTIPPYISILTGITDSMVIAAPRIAEVLPVFLEFARGAVLVAHNAPFDLGFLKAACTASAMPWPPFASVDTAILARRLLTRDEVPNCKLSTLAPYFRAGTAPCHRALADARATVDVLHGLFERLGPLGVQSLEELTDLTRQVDPIRRRKRHLAAHLPHAPGVYLFKDAQDRPLYIGTSHDLARRVRSYFAASEQRSRMTEMVGLAERVDSIVCAHELEAHVRELRLIAEHKPRYNRRSRFPERVVWLKLTVEAFPRLSLVRRHRLDGASYLGPFSSRRQADAAMAAVYDALPIRRCTPRLSPDRITPSCALAGMGRCGAPCEGSQTVEEYATISDVLRRAADGDPGDLLAPLLVRLSELAEAGRFEDAAALRDRVTILVRGCLRLQRLRSMWLVPELVAARSDGAGGWLLAVVRQGRLVAAGRATCGIPVRPYLRDLLRSAETVTTSLGCAAATPDETEVILRWLDLPGTRLVDLTGVLACPARGGAAAGWLSRVDGAGLAATPFADGRSLRTHSQPDRIGAA